MDLLEKDIRNFTTKRKYKLQIKILEIKFKK